MVLIRELIVSPEQEEHIWVRHQVTPEEAEEACLSNPFVIRGRDKSLAVYGQTPAGRYLAVFLYARGKGVYSLATAREMNEAERRRFSRVRGR
ncbi:MAG: BrnT family toxin [Chloroflexota bacterium]